MNIRIVKWHSLMVATGGPSDLSSGVIWGLPMSSSVERLNKTFIFCNSSSIPADKVCDQFAGHIIDMNRKLNRTALVSTTVRTPCALCSSMVYLCIMSYVCRHHIYWISCKHIWGPDKFRNGTCYWVAVTLASMIFVSQEDSDRFL